MLNHVCQTWFYPNNDSRMTLNYSWSQEPDSTQIIIRICIINHNFSDAQTNYLTWMSNSRANRGTIAAIRDRYNYQFYEGAEEKPSLGQKPLDRGCTQTHVLEDNVSHCCQLQVASALRHSATSTSTRTFYFTSWLDSTLVTLYSSACNIHPYYKF